MADGRSSSRTIGIIVGVIILLLLLAWIFGLFGGGDGAEVEEGAIVTEEGATAEEAVEDAAEETEEAVEDAAVETEEAIEEEAAN